MVVSAKRNAALAVLEVLKNYSDREHRLRQSQILKHLENDYGIHLSRKTLHAHLNDLIDSGYLIENDNGWYYESLFCEAELNLFFTFVLSNDFLPECQRRDLLRKIKSIGGAYYAPKLYSTAPGRTNPQFMYTLEVLQSAIDANRQVQFQYAHHDVDKELHPRLNEDGTPYLYLFNPYRIVISNGRYYVIGNMDKYNQISHFRLDRILECTELTSAAKPMQQVEGLENGLHIPEYMEGRAYMFAGKRELVRLRIHRRIIDDVLDCFGMDVRFENIKDDTVEVVLRTDAGTLHYWLKQYDEVAEKIA